MVTFHICSWFQIPLLLHQVKLWSYDNPHLLVIFWNCILCCLIKKKKAFPLQNYGKSFHLKCNLIFSSLLLLMLLQHHVNSINLKYYRKKWSHIQTLKSFSITVARWHYQISTEDRCNHMEQFHLKKSRTIQTTDMSEPEHLSVYEWLVN